MGSVSKQNSRQSNSSESLNERLMSAWHQAVYFQPLADCTVQFHTHYLLSTMHSTITWQYNPLKLATLHKSPPDIMTLRLNLEVVHNQFVQHQNNYKFCPSFGRCVSLPSTISLGAPLCRCERTTISDTIWRRTARLLWTPPSPNCSICCGICLFVVSH